MVLTDACHMVGMTCRMTRRDMLPASINAGCDMFLFFNDPDEDFNTMLNAYKSGVITEATHDGRAAPHPGAESPHGPAQKSEGSACACRRDAKGYGAPRTGPCKEMHKAISGLIALVKYKDADVLPMTPEKYKRIMIVYVTGLEAKAAWAAR
ncbi:MAG: hypothetical protein V8T36_11040 [Ruthenibacterium lactatiformans]